MNLSQTISQTFAWTRYWRTSNANASDDGLDENDFLYLPDVPREAWGRTAVPIHPLVELLDRRCLVLLGRPGSGKTTEIDLIKTTLRQQGEQVLFYAAKTFDGSTDELSRTVEEAIQRGDRVRLILDGADEWQMIEPRFVGAVEERLKNIVDKHGPDTLRLIISSRAAEWPEGAMSSLFPAAECLTARLCQLDHGAAKAYVAHHLASRKDAFWEAVRSVKATFLCVWPHSLRSLVETFAEKGSLPGSLFELVLQTAQMRCDVHYAVTDPDRSRRLRRADADADAKWMFRLASRAAALGVFSGQSGLCAGPDLSSLSGVPYLDFCSTVEPWSPERVRTIQSGDVTDLGRTAVFEKSGNRLVFSHQLMRELLASRWLVDREFSQGQLENLFGWWASTTEWRHYPQLAAVSAWLASDPAKQEWRRFLMNHEPAVLLRSDSANLPDSEKQEIVKALLEQAVREGANDPGWQHRHLRSLSCQGLADILRPYLSDLSPSREAARDLAIDIAWVAREWAVVPELWEALGNPEDPLRSDIACALRDLAKEGSDDKWMEILDGSIPVDRRGELWGIALEVLVPRKLQIRDVVRNLIPKRDFQVIGIYDAVHSTLVHSMNNDDAFAVLRFSTEQFAAGFGDGWRSKEESFLSKALIWVAEELPKSEAANALAEWWLAAIMYHRHRPRWDEVYPSMQDLGLADPVKRHAVLEAVVAHPDYQRFDADDPVWLDLEDFARSPEDIDIDWLLSKLETAQGLAKRIYARLLSDAFYARSSEEMRERLLKAYHSHRELRDKLPKPTRGKDIFEHIEAQWQVSEVKRSQQAAKFRKRQRSVLAEREQDLAHWWKTARSLADAGDPEAWLHIWQATAATRYHQNQAADDEQIVKALSEEWMVQAARRWLAKVPPAHSSADASEAATAALNLLWDEIAGREDWEEAMHPGWLRPIISVLTYFGYRHAPLTVKRCFERFPEKALDALVDKLTDAYRKGGELWNIVELSSAGNAGPSRVKEMLLREPLNSKGFVNALAWLSKADMGAAESVAEMHLRTIPGERFDDDDARVVGAVMVHLEGRLWPAVKGKLNEQPDWQKRALLAGFVRVGWDIESKVDLQAWPATSLSELAEMMLLAFPPASDPQPDGNGSVTALDHVVHSRNRIISVLGNRGLADEVRRLESLKLKGTQRWFRNIHLTANRTAAALRWAPILPINLLALADCNNTRLVRDMESFMRAALEGLRRYQHAISTTATGHALISNDGSPKLEERLSDQLCLWLKDNLKLGGARENQTPHRDREDITLFLSHPGETTMELCIEVKKDSSRDLLKQMDTQLREKYLKAQGRTHGIYVVFWFEDKKRSSHPGISTLEQLEAALASQASQLSADSFRLESVVIDCRALTTSNSRGSRHRTSGNISK